MLSQVKIMRYDVCEIETHFKRDKLLLLYGATLKHVVVIVIRRCRRLALLICKLISLPALINCKRSERRLSCRVEDEGNEKKIFLWKIVSRSHYGNIFSLDVAQSAGIACRFARNMITISMFCLHLLNCHKNLFK